jgi:hypothetical protein
MPQNGDDQLSDYLKADMFSSQQFDAAGGNGLQF